MHCLQKLSALSQLSLICLLAACGNDARVAPVAAPAGLQAQYSSAVADARVASPDEISAKLTPIRDDNPALVWENGVVGSRLLVVTWLGDAGINYKCTDPGGCTGNSSCKEGGNCPSYGFDSWVTVAPELKNFFGLTPPVPLRVAQLLGLPPKAASEGGAGQYKYLLELWVSPKDLFRPCPDTEISDTTCGTGFPTDMFRTPDLSDKVRVSAGPDYGVFKTYSSWFNNRARYSYTMDSDPYPWTRLGYTYDWGSANHTGLSEFVVHGRKQDGSKIFVGIKSVSTTADYFAR